ncbi:hypothetical protein E6W39_19665 [Kitasatospora acidiphila]|uniref:Uncharacterized protein n=1 Tax=Kitasatospora acidiphila TaxID=2567942 RepID=A0A540W4X2_9ACTN|nr:hypothetical protein [Kitasatospora acidiphila]TQF04042.1 hypothetical protein E6W39_19665 [Kitasatospora acidiphila]
MAKSLNPEDITVVHAADESGSAHDHSVGNLDDNDSNDGGGHDRLAFAVHQFNGAFDDTD